MKQSHKDLQKYLMCSYQYYHRYTSLVSDSEYDMLAKSLLENWYDWQEHQHAYIVTKDDLQAGTLFTVRTEDYPMMIVQASEMWAREKFYQDEVQGQ